MKNIIVIYLLLIFSGTLLAGTGTSRLQFLKFSPSVRASAMADTLTSVQGEVDNIFYNPAGIFSSVPFACSFAYTRWFQELNFFNIAGSFKITGNSSVNLGGVYLMQDDIFKVTDNNGELQQTDETIGLNDFLIVGNYSRMFNNNLLAGVNAKMASETLDTKTSSVMAFDAGIIYRFNNNISLGLAGCNVGASDIPLLVRTGISYFWDLKNEIKMPVSLLLAGDVTQQKDSGLKTGIGTELSFWQILSLRTGYSFMDDINGLRLGAGIKYKNFIMDFGFTPYSDLGNISRIGLKMNF